jgi:recombination protein RecA
LHGLCPRFPRPFADVQHDIVEKSGAWYSYNGTRLGQGRDNVKGFLREHPQMAEEIEGKVRAILLPERVAPPEE